MQKARGPTGLPHGGSTACRWTGSGTISLPSRGFFSPFPHGTGSLSVAQEYLALGDGPPGFPQGFSCPVVLGNGTGRDRTFRLRGCHPVSRHFPEPSAKLVFGNFLAYAVFRPTTPRELAPSRFGLFRFRSPLLTESQLLSLPPGTEMVHFPGLASHRL
jgi:hypothetical protein